MLNKSYVKSRKVWKVKFELPVDECPQGQDVKDIHLVGDFNDWAHDATPMTLRKGTYHTSLELQSGHEYQFRYLVNGEDWYNDWEADAYVPNNYGQDNCVVMLPES